MNVGLASLDEWAWHDKNDIGHSNECCYVGNCRHHVWQTVQLADHAIVGEALVGSEVSVVVDMMHAVITIRHGGSPLRRRVVVEGDGYHHWQKYQHQQPRIPFSLVVNIVHYPKTFIWYCSHKMFHQWGNIYVLNTVAKVTIVRMLYKKSENFIFYLNKI